ncbi:hypothetical protein Tco_0869757 [Tanacetum coccineum]
MTNIAVTNELGVVAYGVVAWTQRGVPTVTNEDVGSSKGGPTREVSDLAFRNRTSCGAAYFPCRLLTIMCRFLSVSSLAFGVEFRDILWWDSGCPVLYRSEFRLEWLRPWASQLRSYPLLTRAAAFKAWTVEIASSHYAPFRIPSEPGEMAPESLEAVVLPKFDMHIYTFELTSSE